MKIIKTIGNYDADSGLSTVTIYTDYGNFTGYAKIVEEDKPYENKFTGCRFAEIKATIKMARRQKMLLRANLKEIDDIIKDLSNYCSVLNENKEELIGILNNRKKDVEEAYKEVGSYIKNSWKNLQKEIEDVEKFHEKCKKGKTD